MGKKKIYDIFISYSSADTNIVSDIKKELDFYGYKIFMFEENKETGKPLTTKIFENLYKSKIYLLIISKSSEKSKFVRDEFNYAYNLIHKNEIYFFPIMLEESQEKDFFNVLLECYDYINYKDENFLDKLIQQINKYLGIRKTNINLLLNSINKNYKLDITNEEFEIRFLRYNSSLIGILYIHNPINSKKEITIKDLQRYDSELGLNFLIIMSEYKVADIPNNIYPLAEGYSNKKLAQTLIVKAYRNEGLTKKSKLLEEAMEIIRNNISKFMQIHT